MTDRREILRAAEAELAPAGANRFVAEVRRGAAPVAAVGVLAAQQARIIPADRASFRHLAGRASGAAARWFAGLADGEDEALRRLPALAAASGDVPDRGPLPGCQAYPGHVARIALTAEPAEAVLALAANFAAWGGYCAELSAALRARYGFAAAAVGFFDLFAGDGDGGDDGVLAALGEGPLDLGRALDLGRLLQAYEQQFWDTLAAEAGAA